MGNAQVLTQAPTQPSLRYRVATLTAAGLKAKWGKTSGGAPILLARDPSREAKKHQRENWWYVTNGMWQRMQESGNIREAFSDYTLLGDIFFVKD